MSIALTEAEFVDNLLSLASIHPFKLDDDYVKPQSQLVNLGPPLPPFKYSYKKAKLATEKGASESSGNSIINKTVILKCIKPKTVLKVNSSDYSTVQDLKEYLAVEGLPAYSEFKLLNKGKVLLDYLSLSDILANVEGDELTLNLMCKPKPDEPEPEQEEFVESEEIVIPWKEFQAILEKKYGASEGLKALKKLQLGWEQTK